MAIAAKAMGKPFYGTAFLHVISTAGPRELT